MSDTKEVLALLGWAVRHSWDDHHNEDGDGIRALVQRARNQHDAERATIAALKADLARHQRALAAEKARADNAALDLVGARSLLAEQTARAESAEAERDAAVEGKAEVFFAAEDRERFEATIARLRAALAAGPAALRALVDRGETLPVLADLVEAAQRRAMEEG